VSGRRIPVLKNDRKQKKQSGMKGDESSLKAHRERGIAELLRNGCPIGRKAAQKRRQASLASGNTGIAVIEK